MNFHEPASRGRLDPAEIRLPLIALIDIILFLLMYFILAGSLQAEEAQLGTALAAQSSTGRGSDIPPAVIDVRRIAGGRGVEFRLGARTFSSRGELTSALGELPPSQTIMLRVDDEASVSAVAAAAQAAKDAGFVNVLYLAPTAMRDGTSGGLVK
jgi:biopolymer transport protein ExbD